MNCRAAQRLLSAERDGALAARERADLEAHVAGCADCRRVRAVVAGAIESWRTAHAEIAPPDAERAWQDISREIRTGAPVPADTRGFRGLPRWALASGAAAALIVAATFGPRWLDDATATEPRRLEVARADYVETANNAASMVYVDDKSGWLVVWAVDGGDTL